MEEVMVYLEDSRRVRDLESQVKGLEGEVARLREELRDVSFRYRCETVVNLELLDLCRAHGVRYRPSLAARPWESEAVLPLNADQAGAPGGGDHATARATAPSPEGKGPGGEAAGAADSLATGPPQADPDLAASMAAAGGRRPPGPPGGRHRPPAGGPRARPPEGAEAAARMGPARSHSDERDRAQAAGRLGGPAGATGAQRRARSGRRAGAVHSPDPTEAEGEPKRTEEG